jgi:hypothetical protein
MDNDLSVLTFVRLPEVWKNGMIPDDFMNEEEIKQWAKHLEEMQDDVCN